MGRINSNGKGSNKSKKVVYGPLENIQHNEQKQVASSSIDINCWNSNKLLNHIKGSNVSKVNGPPSLTLISPIPLLKLSIPVIKVSLFFININIFIS